MLRMQQKYDSYAAVVQEERVLGCRSAHLIASSTLIAEVCDE